MNTELQSFTSDRIYCAVDLAEQKPGDIDILNLGCKSFYIKDEADKVIAEKDAEIAGLKAAAKEPSVPNRTCRKCGSAGTLMYMPIVKDGRTYWGAL